MSRLGGAGAVAQLVADVPLLSIEVIKLHVQLVNFGYYNLYLFAFSLPL